MFPCPFLFFECSLLHVSKFPLKFWKVFPLLLNWESVNRGPVFKWRAALMIKMFFFYRNETQKVKRKGTELELASRVGPLFVWSLEQKLLNQLCVFRGKFHPEVRQQNTCVCLLWLLIPELSLKNSLLWLLPISHPEFCFQNHPFLEGLKVGNFGITSPELTFSTKLTIHSWTSRLKKDRSSSFSFDGHKCLCSASVKMYFTVRSMHPGQVWSTSEQHSLEPYLFINESMSPNPWHRADPRFALPSSYSA